MSSCSLGKEAIREAIKRGEIRYLDGTGKPVLEDVFNRLCQGNSLDIRLGRYYWVVSPGENIYYTLCEAKNEVINIEPGLGYLMHSEEFVGSLVPHLNCSLHTRSTLARNFISVHQSAGWGDPGFASRWTLEVTTNFPAKLYVGQPVGQLEFHRVTGNNNVYEGHYNFNYTDWNPRCMLPKTYLISNVKIKE
jgi:deoxycytidine triphosphate deaminase